MRLTIAWELSYLDSYVVRSLQGDDLDPSQFEPTPTSQTAEAVAQAVAPAAAPASQGPATPSTDLAAALAAAFQAIAGESSCTVELQCLVNILQGNGHCCIGAVLCCRC